MNSRAYTQALLALAASVPEARRAEFAQVVAGREKNPLMAFALNAFLGGLGVDKFYLGKPVLGIVKLLTLGGFGIWSLIDCFLLGGAARDANIKMAEGVHASMK